MVPLKRKLTNKSLAEKYKAVKDLESELSNKDAATKYGVPRNTILTWVKNQHKLTALLEKKGVTSSRKNARCGNYEKVDKAIYNCPPPLARSSKKDIEEALYIFDNFF